jgi:hypothetical protein
MTYPIFQCFLLPVLQGDFVNTLGISDYWANSGERDHDIFLAQIYAGVFAFCAFNLFLAIILSICTSPGSIPDQNEWDLPDNLVIRYAEDNKKARPE